MACFKKDADLRMLLLSITIVIAFIGASFYYTSKLSRLQDSYEEKAARLEEIEKQLILQEQKLRELSSLKDSIEIDRKSLEENYYSMMDDYKVLRLEREVLAGELFADPFAKARCEATGNAECHSQ